MLKNPFGLRDGKIVTIAQITPEGRGAKCNCICPLCKGKFEAVLGKETSPAFTPYFRHDGQPCNRTKMLMTAFYKLLCDALDEKQEFRYPDCFGFLAADGIRSLSAKDYDGYEKIIGSNTFAVERYELRQNKKGMPNALLLVHKKGNTLAVIITPPPTICKIPVAKPFREGENELPTISIDMNDKMEPLEREMDLEHIWADELKILLRDGIDGKKWLSSPKIDRWICEQRQKIEHEQQEKERKIRQARQAQEKRQKELNEEYKQNQAMKIQNQSTKPKQLVCPKCKRAVNISAIPRDNNPSGLCRMCLYNLPRR